MRDDMDSLRAKALKSTPGPWRYSPWHIEEGPSCVRKDGYGIVATVASDDQAAYIAACDPQTILALLDENDRLRKALEAVRPSHRGPGCWCSIARDVEKQGHAEGCLAARLAASIAHEDAR